MCRGRASNAHAAALDWPRRLNMAMDAAKGMLHLHLCDPPIIHRDLKSPNLLVDKHWKLKVPIHSAMSHLDLSTLSKA